MIATSLVWTADEAADRLMEESAKAQKNGKGYAKLTAWNAALAVQPAYLQIGTKAHRGSPVAPPGCPRSAIGKGSADIMGMPRAGIGRQAP